MLRWVVLERTARKPSARQEPCLVALPLLRRRQRSRRRVQNWSGYTLDSRSTMPLSGAQPRRQLTVANDQGSSSAGIVPVDRTVRADISLPGTNTGFYKMGMDFLLGIGAQNLRIYAKSSNYGSTFSPIDSYR